MGKDIVGGQHKTYSDSNIAMMRPRGFSMESFPCEVALVE